MGVSMEELDDLVRRATAQIASANDTVTLDLIKSSYLGKRGEVALLLKQLVAASDEERPVLGKAVNDAKDKIVAALSDRSLALVKLRVSQDLNQPSLDYTLPPRGQQAGSLHPVTKIKRVLEDFFISMGFSVIEGPEIETEFYNFTALNMPENHPARTMHDTFYLEDKKLLLRSQTSNVQIRALEKMSLPLRIISPGRVYRRDSDATHSPMFHQLEMLMVDQPSVISMSKLKWLVIKFVKYFFGEDTEYRFRPSYFPFTEPSAEVDVKWRFKDDWYWLELGGCGIVHPEVLRSVKIDYTRYRGIAFGFGIERLAMKYYSIDDIRLLFDSDLQFLRQF